MPTGTQLEALLAEALLGHHRLDRGRRNQEHRGKVQKIVNMSCFNRFCLLVDRVWLTLDKLILCDAWGPYVTSSPYLD